MSFPNFSSRRACIMQTTFHIWRLCRALSRNSAQHFWEYLHERGLTIHSVPEVHFCSKIHVVKNIVIFRMTCFLQIQASWILLPSKIQSWLCWSLFLGQRFELLTVPGMENLSYSQKFLIQWTFNTMDSSLSKIEKKWKLSIQHCFSLWRIPAMKVSNLQRDS